MLASMRRSFPRWSMACLVVPLLDGCSLGAGDEGCEAADDSTLVQLEVDVGDYPVGTSPDDVQLVDVPCDVTAVDLSDPARVRTELDCQAEGGTRHAVVVAHASSDLGTPAWAAGDALRLDLERRVDSDLNDVPLISLALRSPQGEVQLVVLDDDELRPTMIGALSLSLEEDVCGPKDIDEQRRGRLSLTLDGVTATVADGTDGTLETPAGTWAIELERAISGDLGERSLLLELLVMKVQ